MKKNNTALYLIPITFTASGAPLQYRLISHKKDRRYKFIKENAGREYIRPFWEAVNSSDHVSNGDKITISDGKAAALLFSNLKKAGYK